MSIGYDKHNSNQVYILNIIKTLLFDSYVLLK